MDGEDLITGLVPLLLVVLVEEVDFLEEVN